MASAAAVLWPPTAVKERLDVESARAGVAA